jgi:hypothetical protein
MRSPAWRPATLPAGGLLLFVSLAGWWIDQPLFFAAWLSAWWFCLGVVLGATANGWLHTLTGGAWGELLWPSTRQLQRRLPWVLLLFLPMLLGIHVVYPWSADPQGWLASMDHPAFQQHWFDLRFFGLRLVAYALLWAWMARAGRVRQPGRAAAMMALHTLVTSLAAVDLLMSLVPAWSSSVFGWLALMGQMTAGAAASILLAALGGAAPRPAREAPPVWRDLGNLLIMFVLVQAYLQFMQFLIIWAENLPREISWFVPRLQTGWSAVGLALVLLQFAAPLLALLWRSNKDRPRRLACIAGGLLAMQAVDAAWLVVPSVQAQGFGAWWQLPLVFGGMALLLFGQLDPRPQTDRRPSGAAWQEPANG